MEPRDFSRPLQYVEDGPFILQKIINLGGKIMFNIKKKFIGLLIVTLGSSLFLTACGVKTGNKDLNDIKKSRKIVIGLDDTFVPMGYKDDKGKIVGFDVDLAKEACKRMGIKAEFQPIDWTMKETELNSKKIDLIWNGYTITEERKKILAFSQAYLKNRQVIVTLASSSINGKADLKGKNVAAQSASSSLDAINKEPSVAASFKGGAPVLFDTNNEALIDLEAGRSDAVVVDEVLARYYVKQRGEAKYKFLKDDFGCEEYGVGMRLKDANLLKELNKEIDAMKNDGTYQKIYEKWFSKN